LSADKCPERLVVIGGGFVGLHTAVHAAKAGVREVIVIDINMDVVDRINSGDKDKLHVREPYVLENWDAVREKIRASTNYSDASGVRHFIVAVQTPRRGGRVDYTPLKRVAENLAPFLGPGSLVVSEVTIYPGGTYELLAKPLSELSGLKLDEEFFVAHVPERLSAGSRKWTPENIPRVVGGIGPRSLEEALKLYRDCLGAPVHPVNDIRVAEASKLLENSFRLLNISYVNELKRFFDRIGLDIREVIKAASTKPFGYMPFYPGPYAGGACLPKDSLMLEEKTGSLLLRIARYINESQPLYYAALLLKQVRRSSAKRILFYGLGFKPNSPYPVESPVLRVIEELRSLDPGLEIKRFDPQIPGLSDFASESEALEWAEIVVRWGYKDRPLNKPVIDLEKL
jgi:UDP-N-acetyl-D-glucosamine dehydrogenase